MAANGTIKMIDEIVDKPYLDMVKTVKVQDVPKNNIKIVFTPLHGTASVHLVKLLREEGYDVTPVASQMIPDGSFSTVKSPNPEEASAFKCALELGKEVKADVLIATDPDADRMGIAAINPKTNEYQLLTGNQTGAILLDYLVKYRPHGDNAYVFNTIVTSNIAKAICDKNNLHLVQTLTGFKFIGEQAHLLELSGGEFFFGYEESYGYVIKDFVRDKDSFQASLLLAEVASFYKTQNKTLIEVLHDIYKEYGFHQEGVQNIYLKGIEGSERIERIMRYFQSLKITEIAGKSINTIEDYDKGLRYQKGKTSAITLPKSLVLKYIFEDGGWFVLRPSGTEPKLKIYIAIVAKDEKEASTFIERLKGIIDALIGEVK